MTRANKDAGLSLIELVIAMAIFALVAIMGAQALTGMLRMRDGVTQRADHTAALAKATSLLRSDLSAAVPMLFYPPGSPFPESSIRFREDRFGLSVGAQPSLTSAPDDIPLTRVEWQIRDGRLTRRVWPALYPALESSLSPEQLVMEGVRALRLRTYVDEQGWVDGLQLLNSDPNVSFDEDSGAAGPSAYSSALPIAIEVTVETQDYGDIPLIESFR